MGWPWRGSTQAASCTGSSLRLHYSLLFLLQDLSICPIRPGSDAIPGLKALGSPESQGYFLICQALGLWVPKGQDPRGECCRWWVEVRGTQWDRKVWWRLTTALIPGGSIQALGQAGREAFPSTAALHLAGEVGGGCVSANQAIEFPEAAGMTPCVPAKVDPGQEWAGCHQKPLPQLPPAPLCLLKVLKPTLPSFLGLCRPKYGHACLLLARPVLSTLSSVC